MKRVLFTLTMMLVMLQFTCSNVSQKTEIKSNTDNDLQEAICALNRDNVQFWQISYRIDSILNTPGKQRTLLSVKASDPVNQ